MVQAFASEYLHGRGCGLGRRILALMRREPQSSGAGSAIGRYVAGGIDSELGRIHAHANNALDAARSCTPKLHQLFDLVEGDRWAELTVDVEDQSSDDTGRPFGGRQSVVERGDDVGQRLATEKVTRRCEERLAIDKPMLSTIRDALERESFPRLGCGENGLHDPEQVEKLGEVGVAEDIRRVDRKINCCRIGELDEGARPHRALDVAVQLDLWQCPNAAL